MRKLLLLGLALVAAAGAAFYLLTIPVVFLAADLPDHTPDVSNGNKMLSLAGAQNVMPRRLRPATVLTSRTRCGLQVAAVSRQT